MEGASSAPPDAAEAGSGSAPPPGSKRSNVPDCEPNPGVFCRDQNVDFTGVNNRWASVDYRDYKVRCADYLTNPAKPKATTLPAAFDLVGTVVLSSPVPIQHGAETTRVLRQYLSEDACGSDPGFFFIFAWTLPGPPYQYVSGLFRKVLEEGEDPAFDNAWGRFVSGDEEYRNSRLKQFAAFAESSWMVKSTMSSMGGLRPCIIGNKLTSQHFTGHNYVEVNCDVGSSKVATMLKGVILKSATSMVVDCAFCVEGQQEDELPERLIGGIRFKHCDVANISLKLDEDGNPVRQQ